MTRVYMVSRAPAPARSAQSARALETRNVCGPQSCPFRAACSATYSPDLAPRTRARHMELTLT
eukprot:6995132-Prymnesium_polylepis.1